MNFKTVLTWLGLLLPFLATAAMLRWPGNYVYEMALCSAALLTIVVVGWWIVGTFYSKLSSPWQMLVLVFSGIVIGSYAAISIAYFEGYLGDTYPKTEHIRLEQGRDIERLTKENSALLDNLQKTSAALSDAQKTLANPLSVTKPLYKLDTSLKLQFNKSGVAKELEVHNVTWTSSDVTQAKQLSEARHVEPIRPPSASVPAFAVGNDVLSNLSCTGYTCPDAAPTYSFTMVRIMIISFVSPISANEIKIDANGDELPPYTILKLFPMTLLRG